MTRRFLKRMLMCLFFRRVLPGFVVTVGFRLFRLRGV